MVMRGFLWGLLFIVLSAPLQYQNAAAQRVRVAPCVKSNPSYNLPFFAAEAGNFWKKNGIDGEWVAIKGGAAMVRAIAAGALDMGICGPLGGIRAIARGVPEVIIADVQSPQDLYIWVRVDSNIKKPKDLKGAKIAVSRLGGTFHAYGVRIVKALGLEKDIRILGAGGGVAQNAGLRSGAYDAIIQSLYSMAPMKFKGETREVVDVHDYLPKEWMDLAMFAQRDFADNKPDVVGRAVTGFFQASQFVMRDADWTAEKLKKEFGYSEQTARRIHKEVLRYGKEPRISRKAVENARQFLIDAGLLSAEKAPPLEKIYTTKFARGD